MPMNRPRVVGRTLVHPVGCACVACKVKDELRADEMQTVRAAAERAVKDAAMEMWRVGKMDPDEWHAKSNAADEAFNAACAALAALEGK